jgi:hypothetical protein
MVGLEFRGVGNRLSSVKPSIAHSTINDIKTAGVPLVLRIQGTLRNRWGQGIVGNFGFFRAGVAVIIGDRSGLMRASLKHANFHPYFLH